MSRGIDDGLTGGIVRVFPGKPASMQPVIYGEAMEILGKIIVHKSKVAVNRFLFMI
jgi:hypothetical protein